MDEESATLRASYACFQITVEKRDSHHLSQSATIETNGANRFIQIPVESDRSPLYSAAACILRSVPWSAPRYARVETESAPARHLRCGIGVHSYDANRAGQSVDSGPLCTLLHDVPHNILRHT